MSFPKYKKPDLVSNLHFVMFILLLLFLFSAWMLSADAARENKHIGITLSETCLIMLKNNLESNCPSYLEILALFPDTSNQNISGEFIFDNNHYHRDNAKFKTHFEYYLPDDTKRLWIDPPGDTVGRIATITIEPRLNDYLILDSHKMQNNTIVMGHSVYVDKRCSLATVGADDWILKTGQIIQYMGHICDEEFKTFNNTKSIQYEKSYQDITTSYKYKLEKWIAESKVNCLGLCFEY